MNKTEYAEKLITTNIKNEIISAKESIEISLVTISNVKRLTEEEIENFIKKLKRTTKELQVLNNYDKEVLMIKQNLIPLHGARQTCSFHISKKLVEDMENYLGFYKSNSNFSKSDFVNMALFEFIEKYKVQ